MSGFAAGGLVPQGLLSISPTGGSGSSSSTITPSGGILISGAAPVAYGKVKAVSGGAIFSGTASITRVNLQYRTISPTGGVLFSGSAPVITSGLQSRTVSPTGGITISGTATPCIGKVKPVSGGVIFSGYSTIVTSPDNTPVSTRHYKRGRRPRTRI